MCVMRQEVDIKGNAKDSAVQKLQSVGGLRFVCKGDDNRGRGFVTDDP